MSEQKLTNTNELKDFIRGYLAKGYDFRSITKIINELGILNSRGNAYDNYGVEQLASYPNSDRPCRLKFYEQEVRQQSLKLPVSSSYTTAKSEKIQVAELILSSNLNGMEKEKILSTMFSKSL